MPEVISAILEYDLDSPRRDGSPGNIPMYKDIRLLCQKKRKPRMAKNQSAIFFFRRFSSLESQLLLLVASARNRAHGRLIYCPLHNTKSTCLDLVARQKQVGDLIRKGKLMRLGVLLRREHQHSAGVVSQNALWKSKRFNSCTTECLTPNRSKFA